MSKTYIVLGLGFGDEAKGLTTANLARMAALKKEKGIVVRFSGGHNAGHTVVQNGHRHVYSSFGSGTMSGLPTYISEHCVVNPIALVNEHRALRAVPGPLLTQGMYVDPMARVTTPWDIQHNHLLEDVARHGSVGVGIGTTHARNEQHVRLHVMDLLYPAILTQKLAAIIDYYGVTPDPDEHAGFIRACRIFTGIVNIKDSSILTGFQTIIFEGSQGIMLDQEFGFFPNVTRSHTTSKNAMELIERHKLSQPHMMYVTRSYQTRHGNGYMPNEGSCPPLINNEDETNVEDEWQGKFRTGMLDADMLMYAVQADKKYSANAATRNLVVSCLDQTGPSFNIMVKGTTVLGGAKMLFTMMAASHGFEKLYTSDGPAVGDMKSADLK